MPNQQRKTLVLAGLGLLAVWLVCGAGWFVSHRAKATAGKVAAYLHANDLAKMSTQDRAQSLRDLSAQMSALPVEERRRVRMDEGLEKWFAAMSEQEKSVFLEATMPGGLKQMLASFEQLPEDKRRKAVTDALRELRKARDAAAEDESSGLRINTNRLPDISKELQKKVVALGLKTFYAESSAQTKAELAPLLEELQRLMESEWLLRNQRR
jgi:hypothetical protein